VTNTTQYPHVTRAEINRRMVSGQLTPGAAQQTVTDLYSEHPDAATRIVAPDVPRGDLWSATMPTPATPARERPTTPVVVASAPTSAAPALQPAVAPTTTLGPYLAALREEKGMSRTRLGDAIGTHSGIIKTWEDEERRPSPLMVPRLASALDVDPDLLRALVEAQDAPTATTDRAPPRRRGKGKRRGATPPARPSSGKGRTRTTKAVRRTATRSTSPTEPTTPTTSATRVKADLSPMPAPAPDPTPRPSLPRLAWQDVRYRIVQLHEALPVSRDAGDEDNDDDDEVRLYVIERADGRDALGTPRWQQIGPADAAAWMRATQHLIRVLAEGAAHG